jgi:hypothetical protein
MKSESQIEKKLRDRVKEHGGLALKFVSPGCRGVPDRLVFMPGGRIYLVELKAPGQKPRPLQKHMRKKFAKLGFKYYVIDTYETVEVFLSEIRTT